MSFTKCPHSTKKYYHHFSVCRLSFRKSFHYTEGEGEEEGEEKEGEGKEKREKE